MLSGVPFAYRRPAWVQSFAIFLGLTAILLLLVSDDRILSGFKLMSFGAGAVVALLGVAAGTRPPQYWLNWFFTVHFVVVLLSLPFLFLPAGYWLMGWSFQGVFSHPQSFGVYLAFCGSYLIAHLLTSRRVDPILLVVTGLTAYFIFASHCRTAVLAVAASAVVSGFTALFVRRGGLGYPNPWTIARIGTIVLLAVGVLAYDSSRVSAALMDFALKKYSGGGDDPMALLGGSFQGSRGEQVRRAVDSIAAHPFAGVGFGLAAEGVVQVVQHDPLWGLPVSAPVEQGFLPLGVLTQIGIIGAVALGLFLFKLAAPVVRFAPTPVLVMFSTALLLNLGEMMFFATGDLGLQMWLIFGLCHEYAAREARHVGSPVQNLFCRGIHVGTRRERISYAR
jgi:hypothetical protein